jgi:formylglycine-generating enzyme required for sulfatase activity
MAARGPRFPTADDMHRLLILTLLLLIDSARGGAAMALEGDAAMRRARPDNLSRQPGGDITVAQGPAATDAAAAAPKPGDIFRDCSDCVEMVVVPAGQFEMGANDTPFEKPQHRVTIAKPFAIGRREVTFDEWDRCVAEGGCKYRPGDQGWGRGDRPVIDVSWDDAKVFLTWLSQRTGKRYRLPSEAEWEYAARAGTTSAFWWGRDVGKGRANCEDCGAAPERRTTPTGSYRPNAFGLYDTVGNTAEWVEDCWNESYRGAPQDGSAWTSGQCRLRGLRGGSFANKASASRSASRFRYDQDVRYYANGFRVVRDLQ